LGLLLAGNRTNALSEQENSHALGQMQSYLAQRQNDPLDCGGGFVPRPSEALKKSKQNP
jgi:hypothetical protein